MASADDALKLLCHLGYLCYDAQTRTARVPNEEVRAELADAVSGSRHAEVGRIVRESGALLEATWDRATRQRPEASRAGWFHAQKGRLCEKNAPPFPRGAADTHAYLRECRGPRRPWVESRLGNLARPHKLRAKRALP